jgi:hypothetical protein
MPQRSKRNYSCDLPKFEIGVFCPSNQADSESKKSRGAGQVCVRRGGSEALLAANFSKLFHTACFGLPMFAMVAIMIAIVSIMVTTVSFMVATSSAAASPTSRENTPGGGEQGDDGH